MKTKKALAATAALLGIAASATAFDLQITEIYFGHDSGSNLTEDWFEVTNLGSTSWSSSGDGSLFYDDDSADAGDAIEITGLTGLTPGQSAIVVIADVEDIADALTEFSNIWSPDIDLTGVEIGSAPDGSGLSGSGDAVTLWLGDPNATGILSDSEGYDSSGAPDGATWDVYLDAYSVAGNAAGAVTTTALNSVNLPAVGSPGAVPEPGAYAAIAGLLALGFAAWRRRG